MNQKEELANVLRRARFKHSPDGTDYAEWMHTAQAAIDHILGLAPDDLADLFGGKGLSTGCVVLPFWGIVDYGMTMGGPVGRSGGNLRYAEVNGTNCVLIFAAVSDDQPFAVIPMSTVRRIFYVSEQQALAANT
jgi:hypothetical protein